MKQVFCLLLLCWTVGSAWSAETAANAGPRFDVMEYQVEGNSVLSKTLVEEAVTPWLGPGRAIADVEQARAALERAYHEAGYSSVLVDIPEQKVDRGIVVLRVVEGKVERLRVTGARYFSQERILRRAPSLVRGGVPWFPSVQHDLGALNRVADRRVIPVIRPGKDTGAMEVDLSVEDQLPLHGSLEVNNRYSANTSHARMNGALHYDNLWQREHSLSVQFQLSPANTDEVKVLSASYLMPVGETGNQVAFYAVRSRSNVAALSDITVLGHGDIAGVRGIFPLAAGAGGSQVLTLGVDYKHFQENVTQAGTPAVQTPIHYLPFMAQYTATAQDSRGVTQANLGANFALRNVGNLQSDFDNKRYKAGNNYLVLRWDVQRTQALPWGSGLFGRFDGQAADQPLVSNEQYSAGGAESVRGYLEAEQIGDMAVHGTLEWRSPSLQGKLSGAIGEARAHIFLEGAYLRLLSPLPQQQDRFTLSSSGVGLNIKAWKSFSLSADAGWPFKDTGVTQRGKAHAHFSVSYEF